MSGFQEVKKQEVGADGFIRAFAKLSLLLLLFPLLSITGIAGAATYYVAPGGSDRGAGTSNAPWATFSKAMTVLKPGDLLLIKDGTYYQSLDITASGMKGSPITIKAENDGQAVIDGQGARVPCKIYGSSDTAKRHDIDVGGLVCKNSSAEVFPIFYADRVNIKRVSGYNANPVPNVQVFSLFHTTYVLLEDCAASGKGRVLYNVFESQYCTVRRCWGLHEEGRTSNSSAGGSGVQIYGSDDCIVENNVMQKNTAYKQLFSGVSIWAHTYNASCNDNLMVGNVVRDPNQASFTTSSAIHIVSGNIWKNNVGINTRGAGKRCFEHSGEGDLNVQNLTCANATSLSFGYYMFSNDAYYTEDPGFVVQGTLKNSSFLNGGYGIYRRQPDALVGTLTHTYDNFYNISTVYSGTTTGTGATIINPAYDTATYGKGAYLMVPPALQGRGERGADIGAEVLYRYQDGVLTDVPLWPWPMEDRIYRETGISVTWESKGGLWKTLNGVYK
jgi:hypothetical protein